MSCSIIAHSISSYTHITRDQKLTNQRLSAFPLISALDLATKKNEEARIINCMTKSPSMPGTKIQCYKKILKILLDGQSAKIKEKDWQSYIQQQFPLLSSFAHIKKTHTFSKTIFQLGFKGESSNILRTLLIYSSQSASKPHLFFFGNVDVLLVPTLKSTNEALSENSSAWDLIPGRYLLDISRFLDRGQRLNLSELSQLGINLQDAAKTYRPHDPYNQYFSFLLQSYKTSPNGSLLLQSLPRVFGVVHQSPYKKAILTSKTLKMSRGGCIGPLVYSTELVGQNKKDLGGHSIGLLKRKYIAPQDHEDNLLYIEVQKTGNVVTNWIDKVGRGAIFLSARRDVLFPHAEKKDLQINECISAMAFAQYQALYPLLLLVRLWGTNYASKNDTLNTILFFDKIITIMEKIAQHNKTIINGIFFEILKDYILLFQNDERSILFAKKGSFNMANQYQIFFTLAPHLRKHWDTGSFPVCIADVMMTFKDFGLIQSEKDVLEFKKFFLHILNYYIQVGCLEGASEIKNPDELTQYDDLIQHHPNLAGIIFSSIIKQNFTSDEIAVNFFEATIKTYKKFFEGRKMDYVVKAGLARTEEIGIRDSATVRFFSFQTPENLSYVTVIRGQEIPEIKISGFSSTVGFTQRIGGVLRQNSSE